MSVIQKQRKVISPNSAADQKSGIPKLLTPYLNTSKVLARDKHSEASEFKKKIAEVFKFRPVSYFSITSQQEIDIVLACSFASKYSAFAIILLYFLASL